MVKPIVLAIGVALASFAHPLHTSYTEVSREKRGDYLTLSVRLFADDFGSAIDSLGRTTALRGSSAEAVARVYFERSVILLKDGKPVPLSWCGMRSADGLTWLCARTAVPVGDGDLRIRNALMFDRFPDQISIIRVERKSKARTLVLSARAPEAKLD